MRRPPVNLGKLAAVLKRGGFTAKSLAARYGRTPIAMKRAIKQLEANGVKVDRNLAESGERGRPAVIYSIAA